MEELNRLTQELEDRFNRWENLKENGGSDPFWADGCNMNLIRNHIYSYKRQIKELCEENGIDLPQIYHREPPQEIENNYMARVDKIRKNAKRALAEYKSSKDYQYLLSVVGRLGKREIEQTSIDNVIGYCKGLESFIEKDDLIAMRRHESWERYLQSFWDCRKRVEEILKEEPKEGQISLFEF